MKIRMAFKGKSLEKAIIDAKAMLAELKEMTDEEFQDYCKKHIKVCLDWDIPREVYVENYMLVCYEPLNKEEYLYDDYEDLPEVEI